MKRRAPLAPSLDPSGLPADIAAGPDPERWGSWSEWHAAGAAWSTANGLGAEGWRDLLTDEVRYLTTALGRAHVRAGLRPPWRRAA